LFTSLCKQHRYEASEVIAIDFGSARYWPYRNHGAGDLGGGPEAAAWYVADAFDLTEGAGEDAEWSSLSVAWCGDKAISYFALDGYMLPLAPWVIQEKLDHQGTGGLVWKIGDQ
tara:strand:+ start:381 stop:722 length:342 start_codon:yes stop_codon:yes gene_type:complete